MRIESTRSFAFSASYTQGARAVGRNFTLSVTVEDLPAERQEELEARVRRELIDKVHTRDLSLDVDFLKNTRKDDAGLLQAFWDVLSGPLAGYGAKRLSLQSGPGTVTTLYL